MRAAPTLAANPTAAMASGAGAFTCVGWRKRLIASNAIATTMAKSTAPLVTPERTFGYLRMEILAALANRAVLFAIVVAIAFEAMSRLRHPTHVNAPVLDLKGAV